MSKLDVFREFITQRLTTAAMEIFSTAEKSFADFEEEISRSKKESARLQRLLDIVTQPEIKLHRTDVQHHSLPEPPQIKEEQELWTSQEEEQLQGLQSETTDSMFTSNSVKHVWDQEGFSEWSHVDQTVEVEGRKGNSLPSNTTEEQIKIEPDGQDHTEPDSDSQPFSVVAPDIPTAQSFKEEKHGEVLLFQKRIQNNEAPTMENMPQRRHAGKTIHQCQQCSKTFTVKSALMFHMRTHTVKTFYQCQICNKQFAQKYNLVIHIRTHTGEKPYQCQECSKQFARSDTLVAHMKTHTVKKSFQCHQCNKWFGMKYSLVVHMRTHTGEKPYQCQECNKLFAESSSLLKHRRTHTGEKPFQCQQCNKRFSMKYSLGVHMRTHTGEKPYRCHECSKHFAQSSCLLKHIRTHTGEKPYKCQECSKSFSQSANLNKHTRTHRRGALSISGM